MNSFKSIERALEYEVSRQIEMAEKGTPIIQSTLRWDDVEGRTYLMRTKENAQDYRYFPESDLSIINVSEELINNIENFLKVLYEELKDSKIQRIEAEKESTTKNVAYLEYKGIQVILNGRADLLIETDKARYIIDFKTGSYNKDQLEFYSIMFYGSDNSLPVYSAAYNFWEEEKDFDFSKHLIAQLDEKDNNFKTFLKEFLETKYYILPNKSSLKENDFDFNEYYRYKNIIALEKMGDFDE